MPEYSYSTDGEHYHGTFASIEDALDEAFASSDDPNERIFVGECVAPTQPETYWDAADWLEHVSCQDEYSCDWSEDWGESTNEQRIELETEVRQVMAAWLDRHGLRPRFWSINNDKQYTRDDYEAMVRTRRGPMMPTPWSAKVADFHPEENQYADFEAWEWWMRQDEHTSEVLDQLSTCDMVFLYGRMNVAMDYVLANNPRS